MIRFSFLIIKFQKRGINSNHWNVYFLDLIDLTNKIFFIIQKTKFSIMANICGKDQAFSWKEILNRSEGWKTEKVILIHIPNVFIEDLRIKIK